MTFRVGQKVCCVDDGWLIGHRGKRTQFPSGLVRGGVYTITGFDDTPGDSGGLAFRLAEIRGLYYHHRFRPIVDKQTDISVFEEILHRVSRKQPKRV